MTLQELMAGIAQQLFPNEQHSFCQAERDRLVRYLNDAVIDLTGELQPRKTEIAQIVRGDIDLSKLSRSVIKVISIQREGARLPLYYGVSIDTLRVPATADGAAFVTYRYMPEPLKIGTDVPELPEWSHHALVNYAVGRDRACGDAGSIMQARVCFEAYTTAKHLMRSRRGEMDSYAIEATKE